MTALGAPVDRRTGHVAAAPSAAATKPRRGIPLRISLVALTLVLVVLGLLASGLAVTSAMKSDLISRTDSELINALQSWARPRDHVNEPTDGPPGPRRPPSQFFAMTVLTNGDTIINNDFSSQPDISALPAGDSRPVTIGSAGGDGPEWRAAKTSNANGVSVVATPLTDVNATLSRLMWLQLGIGTLVVLVIGALSYLLVRSSLRPLRRVEETAHAIAAGNLNMRVPPAPPNTEVGSLSASLNTMLGQIQRAFARTAASEQEARASEDKMRQFIADASHELRTPLTSIKGFAELYKQGAVSDVPDAMGRIDAEAGRMGLLVEDLLMLARLDAHRPIAEQPVDILGLAADAVQSAKAAAPQRAISLEIGETEEPPMVTGDAPRLLQVLRNLINNAIAHTPDEASITVGVAVDTSEGHDDVVLTVADTGQGLAPEDASRVFERFYRGDSSRHRGDRGGGSGLGLSIVAALVHAHGGAVGVESTQGVGSTFWVRLPRRTD